MNDEALRIHSFKANSKVFQQKFTLSQAARADTNPKGTLFKECHCLFISSKEAFRSYLMIFKCKDLWCALYRWSCGLISKKTGSLQCRRFYRARANGFNRESAMLKLPKRGGNGFLCHRIKDGGFIVVIRLTSFRPRKTRLHCRLENWEPSDPFCNTSLWETLIL